QGNPRIYVNDTDLNTLSQKLTTALGEDLANFIIAYRMYGSASATTQPTTSPQPASTKDTDKPQSNPMVVVKPVSPTPAGAGGGGGAAGGSARLTRSAIGNVSQGRPKRIASLFELIGAKVAIPSGGQSGTGGQTATTQYSSPLNDPTKLKQLLPLLLDKTTTSKGTEV